MCTASLEQPLRQMILCSAHAHSLRRHSSHRPKLNTIDISQTLILLMVTTDSYCLRPRKPRESSPHDHSARTGASVRRLDTHLKATSLYFVPYDLNAMHGSEMLLPSTSSCLIRTVGFALLLAPLLTSTEVADPEALNEPHEPIGDTLREIGLGS